jgi:hypothetical protein
MSQTQYLLLDPDTGQYKSFSSIADAKSMRDELIKPKLQKLKAQYQILEETIYENGDSETRPLPDAIFPKGSREVDLTPVVAIPQNFERHHLLKKIEVI